MKPAAVADLNRIEVNPEIMLGKPVVRGTRIPVYLIVDWIESGHTPAEIVDGYPDLTLEDIAAALAYTAAANLPLAPPPGTQVPGSVK